MKRRVSDIAVMILSFLVLLALSAGAALVGVEAVRGEQWQLIRLTAWLQGSGVWGGMACIAVAVLALVLALMCLWRVFPHRTASQRGYVMQKNENGSIGVSIRAIEGLIRTCIDKHEAIAKADITVEECRDGIAIGLHIIQAAGVNIPLSVGALQKQIKQYVTACTGVDVHVQGVSVEKENNALNAGAKKALAEDKKETPLVEAPESEEKAVEDSTEVPEEEGKEN